MAFCIFCGAPLKPGGKPSMLNPMEVTQGSRASQQVGRPRTCVSCGQTDPLNSVFCIFCGASVDGNAGVPVTGGKNGGSGVQQAVADVGAAAPEQRGNGRSNGLLAAIVAGVLGSALGVGIAFLSAQNTPPAASVELPAQGLAILTAQPHSFFQISSKSNKRFLAGKTGPDGDIAIEDLRPDAYDVTITSPSGQNYEESVDLQDGDNAVIIGGPPKGELFSK
jgi:hypothetical protein